MSIAPRCTCNLFGPSHGHQKYCPRHGPIASTAEWLKQRQAERTMELQSLRKAALTRPPHGGYPTLTHAPEIDRDSDGELLIDWAPGRRRMLSMTLRDDGRLSYAFIWDDEKAHGTAQMPPPYSKEPDSYSNAPFSGALEQETVAEWTGLEPATPGVTGRCAK